MNYPLASDNWNWKEKLAIFKVMTSGRYTMGPEVMKFEKEFATHVKSEHAIMVNSGSSANLVGLSAWMYANNIQPGMEVIVPSVSWSTTYFPITQLGLVPVFVDVDDLTFNISVAQVITNITEKTCAVMAVNLLGMPCELKQLYRICKEKNIALIEDNCESFGAKHWNRQCGTYGTFGTFSFFFSHHLQTMEGGMIVTDDDALADYARAIRAHGWVRDIRSTVVYRKGSYPAFEENYKFIVPGYCMRPLEFSAAVGREQLKKANMFIERRRENAEVFQKEFYDLHIQYEGPSNESSWFGFGVILPEGIERQPIVDRLKANGVEVRPVVTGNFLNQPCLKYMPHRYKNYPVNAEHIDKQGFYFGNDHRDRRKLIPQVRDIIGVL